MQMQYGRPQEAKCKQDQQPRHMHETYKEEEVPLLGQDVMEALTQ